MFKMIRIIARRILREFAVALSGRKEQPAVKAALDAWFDEVSKAQWTSSADVTRLYVTASIVNAGGAELQRGLSIEMIRNLHMVSESPPTF